ncbi:MAG: zinc-dependent metalloprotease family protein [Actinomycetes bacterium]
MARRLPALAAVSAAAVAGLLASGAAAGTSATGTLTAAQTGAGAPLATGGAAPQPGPHGIIDVESLMRDVDCDEAQLTGPAATSTAHVTGEPAAIDLDVLTVVDVAEGKEIAAIADPAERAAAEQALYAEIRERLLVGQESYADLGIDLVLDRFDLLAPERDTRTDNAEEIIALAKAQYGGQRPADVDVVSVVTDIDIQVPGLGNAVAGMADCIGGVALPDRAFAVSETGVLTGDEGIPVGPITFYKDLTAKIVAHEIGHLMGGHHHYQECGTAAPVALERGEPGPCTLMTNAVDFQTIPFSTLNGVVVRGHAETWATATDGDAASAEAHDHEH